MGKKAFMEKRLIGAIKVKLPEYDVTGGIPECVVTENGAYYWTTRKEIILAQIVKITEDYMADDYKLTLRQLYYQLVQDNIIPNNDRAYAKLSALVRDGRLAGIIDWDVIEDRTRMPSIPYSVDDVPDAINDTIYQYRLNRMRDQDVYIEVWVEKDALSSVLKRVTQQFHVNLVVNKGYSSASAMYEAYKRIRYQEYVNDKKVIVLYLGDHDPSGLDMLRDIGKRFEIFGVYPEIKLIALTQAQIKQYNPPPNPAKFKDPRSKEYIAKYGKKSWELDALPPKVLHQLLEDEILGLIDLKRFNSILEVEKVDKEVLSKFKDKYDEEN